MTFSFKDCKSILKYDGTIYNNYIKDRNVIVVFDNDIISHNFDEETYKPVVVILSGPNFNRYFLNNRISKAIQNEKSLLIPRVPDAKGFNRNYQKFNNDFFDSALIGHGGFGRVYKAQHKDDLYFYAIKKIIFKLQNFKKGNFHQMLTEFRILATLNHPHVIRYHTAWFEVEEDSVEDSDSENDSGSSELCDSRSIEKSDSLIVCRSMSNDNNIEESVNYSQGTCITDNSYSSKSNPGQLEYSSCNFLSQKRCNSASQNSSHKSANNEAVQVFSKVNQTICNKLVLYIQMELCTSNLHDWLETRNRIPGELTQNDRKATGSLARQLLSAMDYIHSNNVVHRDIKPANVLLTEHIHGVTRDIQLKIGDFGLAKYLTINDETLLNYRLSANVGTSFYTAPEVLHSQRSYTKYNHKCDLYSMGIILLELMIKFTTVSELSHSLNEMKNGDNNDSLSLFWSREAVYVKNLVSSDSKIRPDAGFILRKTDSFKDSSVEIATQERLCFLTEENNILNKKVKELEEEIKRLQRNK